MATANPASAEESPAAVLQELRSFQNTGRVLYVAAHPDDENTQLIAYFARGRNYRTAYLSLTRGDGGQNVLSADFDEKLGVARTQELLAARRLDGGEQFFTRAIDFGFSKDYRETLNIWNKDEVLSDVVRVIRTFRPDVIITRFSPQPGGTHGHHTASAVLALEAFKVAGDTNAYPDQLKTLQPWQPKRILLNGRGNEDLKLDINGTDPVSRLSFSELAARSRAMHKTQGFDNFRGFGGGPRPETFQLLAGEPATNDIMDGVVTNWARFNGSAEIEQLVDHALANFDSTNLLNNVKPLLEIHAALSKLPDEPSLTEKKSRLDRIIAGCLGLTLETSIANAEAIPGESLKLTHSVHAQTNAPVRWLAIEFPSLQREVKVSADLRDGKPIARELSVTLPANTPLAQPYWLREERGLGTFRVADQSLIGQPENQPVLPVKYIFEVAGQKLVLEDQPKTKSANPEQPPRSLAVIPPVSVAFASDVTLFKPGDSRSVEVTITANRKDSSGTAALKAPDGWKVSPAKQDFHLAKAGDRAALTFTVTAPVASATAQLSIEANVGGVICRTAHEEVSYPHIPLQLLQPVAKTKVVSLDLTTRGHRIGYIPGAGDDIPAALRQMGYEVTTLTIAALSADQLKPLDAIVIGVRAFNVRSGLSDQTTALFDYVQNGGTVVAQYNRPDNRTMKLAPYDLRISGDRVTDENAEMTFLAPEHPVLNTPNKITAADFNGWVQERGIYFPNQWDDHFTPILACHDTGEKPLNGGLLIVQYGKGHFVYTGLAFFRQLPAGVPGAYRLFANLVSLGAE